MQPSRMPSAPRSARARDDPPVLVARPSLDDADAQLVVDHVVDDLAVGLVGHEHVEAVAVAQPADVEVLLHRVAGREQADAVQAVAATAAAVVSAMCTNGIVDRVSMIASATLCIVFVHSTSSSAPAASSAGASRGEPLAGLVPAPVALQLLDLGEVDRAQQAVGGVQAAEPLARRPR